jgi:uncharacterized membrane protein
MKPRIFINQLDDQKIIDAIAHAELQTSGEIRIFISSHEIPDALPEAKRQFTQMGMQNTAERNAVLIYIAPKSQTFAIVGDTAIHAKCGENFWNDTAAQMRAHLKQNQFTQALLTAIASIGALLAQHFPHRPDDRNELPNQLEGD